jgi:hypothetical protein
MLGPGNNAWLWEGEPGFASACLPYSQWFFRMAALSAIGVFRDYLIASGVAKAIHTLILGKKR